MRLKVGDQAPEVALIDQYGKQRRSRDLRGKALVLFFYPKDETPGCTAEACAFRDAYGDFTRLGAEVWGVSEDNRESHSRFAERYNLPFPLLCDKNNYLRQVFGVPKTLGIVPGRVTYVINKQGKICLVFNNLLDGPAHVEQAKQMLETLNK